jgi:hypothetical protein
MANAVTPVGGTADYVEVPAALVLLQLGRRQIALQELDTTLFGSREPSPS